MDAAGRAAATMRGPDAASPVVCTLSINLDEDPLRAADHMTLDRSMSQGPPASASHTEAEKSRPPIHFHPLPSVVFFFFRSTWSSSSFQMKSLSVRAMDIRSSMQKALLPSV